MPKPAEPKDVFDELMKDGAYEEAHLDKEEVRKVLTMAMEDYAFGKKLRKMENPSWRVIFHTLRCLERALRPTDAFS